MAGWISGCWIMLGQKANSAYRILPTFTSPKLYLKSPHCRVQACSGQRNIAWIAAMPNSMPIRTLGLSASTTFLCLLTWSRFTLLIFRFFVFNPYKDSMSTATQTSQNHTIMFQLFQTKHPQRLWGNTLAIKHRAPGLKGLSSIPINTLSISTDLFFCNLLRIGTTYFFLKNEQLIGSWIFILQFVIFCGAWSRPLDLLEGSQAWRGGRRTNSSVVCHAMNLGIAAGRAENMDEKHEME